MIVLLYAKPGLLTGWKQTVQAQWGAAFKELALLDTADLDGFEPFGFRDGVSQPEIDWDRTRYDANDDAQLFVNEIGTNSWRPGVRCDELPNLSFVGDFCHSSIGMTTIESAATRRKFAQRFAETSPTGLGEKGEARPVAEWRAAFAAVAEEIASADGAIREAKIKQRDLDREIARLEAGRNREAELFPAVFRIATALLSWWMRRWS